MSGVGGSAGAASAINDAMRAGLLRERREQHGRRVATVMCGGNLDAHLLVELLAGRPPQV